MDCLKVAECSKEWSEKKTQRQINFFFYADNLYKWESNIYMSGHYFGILVHLSKNINFLPKTVSVALSSG